jgi:hypothetical protein
MLLSWCKGKKYSLLLATFHVNRTKVEKGTIETGPANDMYEDKCEWGSLHNRAETTKQCDSGTSKYSI